MASTCPEAMLASADMYIYIYIYIYICGLDINWVKGFKRKTDGNGDGGEKEMRPET